MWLQEYVGHLQHIFVLTVAVAQLSCWYSCQGRHVCRTKLPPENKLIRYQIPRDKENRKTNKKRKSPPPPPKKKKKRERGIGEV